MNVYLVLLAFMMALTLSSASSMYIDEREANNSVDLFRNSKTFGSLKNLKYLYLHNNKIQYVRSGLLDDITCLGTFNFDNNVCKITTTTVGGCVKIASTTCGVPPIETTTTRAPTTTTTTTIITSPTPTPPPVSTPLLPFHLTAQILSSWGYTFNEAAIDLSNMNIGSIESNLLSQFSCLKSLTIRNNKLVRLYHDTFKGCACLKYLDLSYNRLSQLQEDDFDGAENLETFYINNNVLEHINLNTFLKMTKITLYSFYNNPISNLYMILLSNGVLTTTLIG
jgi:hypothetical protein